MYLHRSRPGILCRLPSVRTYTSVPSRQACRSGVSRNADGLDGNLGNFDVSINGVAKELFIVEASAVEKIDLPLIYVYDQEKDSTLPFRSDAATCFSSRQSRSSRTGTLVRIAHCGSIRFKISIIRSRSFPPTILCTQLQPTHINNNIPSPSSDRERSWCSRHTTPPMNLADP